MNGWIVPHQDIVSHRMMKQKIYFLCSIVGGIHQLQWKRKKKKEMREKRKGKVSPMVSQEEECGGVPRQAFPSGCLLQCIRCSLNIFFKVIL